MTGAEFGDWSLAGMGGNMASGMAGVFKVGKESTELDS